MVIKKKKLAYELEGKHGGGFLIYVLPRKERHAGVDGIQMRWRSSDEAKRHEDWHWVAMKDWEALMVIEGLAEALLVKRKG